MIRVCRLEDIPKLGARRIPSESHGTIAVFRTADDRVFAQGIVFGESVACPLHNMCIDLNTGQAAAPDEGTVERFEARVVEGEVEVQC